MELFLIRHAESRNNIRKSDQERVSDPELTDNGRLQSIHLAEFFQKCLHLSRTEYEENKKPLDQIYCSAMKRSLDTVNPVGVAIGLNPEVWLDIHEVGGIYEFNSDLTKKIGRSGLNRKQIQHFFPEYFLPEALNDEGWWNKDAEIRSELSERLKRVIKTLKERAEENVRIGLVAHGGFISSFLCTLFHLKPAEGTAFQSYNCSISRITFKNDEKIMIQYLNHFSFLPENLRVYRPRSQI